MWKNHFGVAESKTKPLKYDEVSQYILNISSRAANDIFPATSLDNFCPRTTVFEWGDRRLVILGFLSDLYCYFLIDIENEKSFQTCCQIFFNSLDSGMGRKFWKIFNGHCKTIRFSSLKKVAIIPKTIAKTPIFSARVRIC